MGETALDTLTYTISDGHGGTAIATVTVTVTGENDAPDAVDDSATVDEDGPLVSRSTSWPTTADPDTSDTLTITSSTQSGRPDRPRSWTGRTGDRLRPNGAFESLAVGETALDTLSYTISDGHGGDRHRDGDA